MSTLAEQMIEFYKDRFNAADQRKTKTVFTVAGRVGVATPGEKILYLPNGASVKVTTDESGTATQVEEDEALHAIVRPKAIKASPIWGLAGPQIRAIASPPPIRATTTTNRPGG